MKKPIKPCGTHPLRWSKWMYPMSFSENPGGPGQYQVRATNAGKPLCIMYPKKEDDQGLIYWGETQDLSDRFMKLVWSFQNPDKKPKHSAARKYFGSQSLQQEFPLSGIPVRYKRDTLLVGDPRAPVLWKDGQGKDRAGGGERVGRRHHKVRFGTFPPLNSIAGKKLPGPPPNPSEPPPDPVDSLIESSDAEAQLARIRGRKR